MRVLIVEGAPGAADSARKALADAGHDIADCHPQGSTALCRGLGGDDTCPLEHDGGVDVVVLASNGATRSPTASEDGVRCALRRSVPVALTGTTAGSIYAEYATEISEGFDDVVGAAERAARRMLVPHSEAARSCLRSLLISEGLDAANADATVTRHRSLLTVTLSPGVPMDPALAETASVRALAAVRAVDRTAAIIDVMVSTTPPPAVAAPQSSG